MAIAMAMMAAKEVITCAVGSLWNSAVLRRGVAVDNNCALKGGRRCEEQKSSVLASETFECSVD
jgi:putative hemolysin